MAFELGPGVFLLSDPALTDPHFEETVVLLCAHSEEGSMGLVVNRPTELQLEDVLHDLGPLDGGDHRLSLGGPVAMEQLHVLYGGTQELADSLAITDGVWLGGRLKEYMELLEAGAPMRFFLGYSGWDAGQLDGEMETGSWRVVPADSETVFGPAPETLWSRLVGLQDPSLSWLLHRPQNPSSN